MQTLFNDKRYLFIMRDDGEEQWTADLLTREEARQWAGSLATFGEEFYIIDTKEKELTEWND